MADASQQRRKQGFVKRRYLLDRKPQLAFAALAVGILAGIGLLYAGAVFVLLDSDLLRDRTVAETRVTMLLVHFAYFVVGGTILFAAVLFFSHRFVGPARVMHLAVVRMRRGDFDGRLELRRRDYHKDLAEQLRLLRDEMRERQAAREHALRHVHDSLERGDALEARRAVEHLLDGSAGIYLQHADADEAEPTQVVRTQPVPTMSDED